LCTEVRGGLTRSIRDRSEYRPNQANVIGFYILQSEDEYLLIFYDNKTPMPPAHRRAASIMPIMATVLRVVGSAAEAGDVFCRFRGSASSARLNREQAARA
jgi:hypothetical protein